MKNLKISILILATISLSGCNVFNKPENDINKSSLGFEVEPLPVEPVPGMISESDTMTRQFTTSELDLLPIPNSTRPSAVILFNKGVNVEEANKAFCEGFVQLPPIADVDNTRVEDQVVTKLPVNKKIPQDTANCDEILEVYDYNLAKKTLIEINPTLQKSHGPFIAVYEPNSTKVSQIIDLRGTSPEKLKAFGQKWHTIFTAAAQDATTEDGVNRKYNILDIILKVGGFFKTAVCITDPNLIYIFHESAGKLADLMCKNDNA